MKKQFATLLFILITTIAFAQSSRNTRVPLFIASPKVDSLLDVMAGNYPQSQKYFECCLEDGTYYGYEITIDSLGYKNQGIYCWSAALKHAIGYFRYKKRTVFITNWKSFHYTKSKDPFRFFKKTSTYGYFKFRIPPSYKDRPPTINELMNVDLDRYHYNYKTGKFELDRLIAPEKE